MKSSITPSKLPDPEQVSETTWIVTLEEDPETGDLIMPIPTELMEAQGWAIGDTLDWDIDKLTGSASLSKKK
jgi:hypothetical protein